MAQLSLEDLTITAADSVEPRFVAASTPKLGGVDPLGLRQINFDLMDQVFPGINNVGRHIRPFVLVSWAWRRAQRLAQEADVARISVDTLRDFVDRIEVIYTWSQFLRNPDADLPGQQVLGPFVRADRWVFGGNSWKNFREARRYSTALTAPINYGPALKTLGWLAPHQEDSQVLIPTPMSESALNAFETRIKHRLDHPAFSKFGKVTVMRRDVKRWSDEWSLDEVTEAEKEIMAKMLLGSAAPVTRRNGCRLMLAAVAQGKTSDATRVRGIMAGVTSRFAPRADLIDTFVAWRRIQLRQLFRLSLEALLYWTISQVEEGPRFTEQLVDAFLSQAGRPIGGKARAWLHAVSHPASAIMVLRDQISTAMGDESQTNLASTIVDAIAFCIAEAPEQGEIFERLDRLPLFRARREAEIWGNGPTKDFVRHILESWVLAQHVYWSVGRGLADARARGKTILRLKVVLEDSGWTLAPGVSRGRPPIPTADRLETALTLAKECGRIPPTVR